MEERPLVNRLGGEVIASFNYRARFLPKWHDLCERTLGRQLETAPELERLHALGDSVLGFAASRNAWTVAPRPRRRWSRAS